MANLYLEKSTERIQKVSGEKLNAALSRIEGKKADLRNMAAVDLTLDSIQYL